MEIEIGEKIYERTEYKNIFLEWRLVSREILMDKLISEKEKLEKAIDKNPVPLEYPEKPTQKLKDAVDEYNKSHVGPVPKLKHKVEKLNTLIKKLNRLKEKIK